MKKYTASYEVNGEVIEMTLDGYEPAIFYADSAIDAEQAACAELLREVCEAGDGMRITEVNIDRFTADDIEYKIKAVKETVDE